MIVNPGFETGDLTSWRVAGGTAHAVGDPAYEGNWSLALGPGPSSVEQDVTVKPKSRYRLSGWLKSGSGAEEVRLGVKGYSGAEKVAASALVAYSQVSVEFETGAADRRITVFVTHPSGGSTACADGLSLQYVGAAESIGYAGVTNSIAVPPPRVPESELGVAQQPNDAMRWLLDAKFGMFIPWGLYSGPGRGEWYMHNAAIRFDRDVMTFAETKTAGRHEGRIA